MHGSDPASDRDRSAVSRAVDLSQIARARPEPRTSAATQHFRPHSSQLNRPVPLRGHGVPVVSQSGGASAQVRGTTAGPPRGAITAPGSTPKQQKAPRGAQASKGGCAAPGSRVVSSPRRSGKAIEWYLLGDDGMTALMYALTPLCSPGEAHLLELVSLSTMRPASHVAHAFKLKRLLHSLSIGNPLMFQV